ncbi:MAG: MCE family protein [Bryobacterales bacterium]|nr:MCE family protein [Bryobacterales bacterium]
MPSPQKVAWAQLRVGVVAVVAMILLAILVFLLTGKTSFFEKKVRIYTFLSDSAAMAEGAEVRLNGIQIGKVIKVDMSGSKDLRKAIRVDMEVDEGRLKQITTDSTAAIGAANVLGSKYINIKGGKASTHVPPEGTVNALDTSTFDDVVASGYNTLEATKEMLKRIDNIVSVVEQGKGSIGKLIYDEQLYANLNGTAAAARKMSEQFTAQLGDRKTTIGKLLNDEDVLIGDMRKSIARVNLLLDGLEQGQGSAGKLLKSTELHDELRKTISEFRVLTADLNAGKGSAGKLLKDETTINRINNTLAKVDQMIAKLNAGQGTLGQLMVNQQLYDSLNGTTREFHEFMKDFRKNPKKFLSIKLGLF